MFYFHFEDRSGCVTIVSQYFMLITGFVCLCGLFMSFVIFLCACIDVYSHFCLPDMKEYILKRREVTE